MKKLEYILAGIVVISLIARDGIPETWFETPFNFTVSILGLCYLFGFWWIQKPPIKNFRSLSMTILYGVVCFCWTITVQFVILYINYDVNIVLCSTILTIGVLAIDLVTSIGKVKIINQNLGTRIAAFAIFCLLLISIPQHFRIQYTYRDNPEFLRFYQDHYQKEEFFQDIRHQYKQEKQSQ